jgi:UTP--glucose-1-phosphate uridylyltransferase
VFQGAGPCPEYIIGNIVIRKCLFPVAGYGTRFLPATKSMPKEMLPIVNKPLVQYGVEEAIEAGLKEIALVTGRGKRAIADHFDISYELESQIAGTSKERYLDCIRNVLEKGTFMMTRQREMKGLGHAILTGECLIGDEAFGVILSDDLCLNHDDEGVMAQMVKLYSQFRCSIVAIQEVPLEDIEKYGVIAGEEMGDGLYRVSSMVEKPKPEDAPTNMAVIGRYILTPDIFDILRDTPPGKNGEVQLTDALMTQAKNGCVLAYKFRGKRFDCGSVPGFIEATNYVYENIYSEDSV